jgi:hypothetical protein
MKPEKQKGSKKKDNRLRKVANTPTPTKQTALRNVKR